MEISLLITMCAREICLFDMHPKERKSLWACVGNCCATVARKALEPSITSAVEGPGRIVCHRAYRGPRPINTAYLSAVE